MDSERLKAELETYEEQKTRLVETSAGKFVTIRDHEILGIWDSYERAVKDGYEKCGLTHPFLVKQICAVERVQFVTRGLSTCRS